MGKRKESFAWWSVIVIVALAMGFGVFLLAEASSMQTVLAGGVLVLVALTAVFKAVLSLRRLSRSTGWFSAQ
jgi:uncharacterized protein HemY